MLNRLDPVLIDFGAIVPLGSQVREETDYSGMNTNREDLTPEYDLFCIVTTLVQCSLPHFQNSIATILKIKSSSFFFHFFT